MLYHRKIVHGNLDITFFYNEGDNFQSKTSSYFNNADLVAFHQHINYEIHYIISGTVSYTINNSTYTASSNSFLVIPPKTFHKILFHTRDFSCFTFEFAISNNKKDFQVYEKISNIIQTKLHQPILIKNEIPEIYQLKLLYESKFEKTPVFELTSDYLFDSYSTIAFFKIFSALEKETEDNLCVISNNNSNSYYNVTPDTILILDYINVHFNNHPNIHDLAKALNLSVRQTERVIRNSLNSTFSQLVNEHRILLAKQLIIKSVLGNDKKSFENISLELGFSNYHTFLKQFKVYTKMSPAEYKKGYIEQLF